MGRGLGRAARAGRGTGRTPDAPRGPRGVFKPGALLAAQMASLPVVPISVRASSGWRFRSWDGFLMPKPLSKITLEYHPPVWVPREADRGDLETLAEEVAEVLNRGEAGR